MSSIHVPGRFEYALRAYGRAPVTFFRHVVTGRDPYWRQYFWNRWSRFEPGVLTAVHGGPVIWIDALSGGETTQAVSFCRLLGERLPGHRLLFSTNNKYSHDYAVKHLAVDAVIDSPWDLRQPVRRALDVINPTAVVGIESVTAPVLFMEASARSIPTVLVSAIMSSDIHRHPMLRRTMQWHPFGTISRIGAKSPLDADGFVKMGARPESVEVTGNMKYDSAFLDVSEERRRELRASLQVRDGDIVLLAASIHPGEEELVGRAYLALRSSHPTLHLVAVPRYGSHADAMAHTLAGMGLRVVRRSEGTRPAADDVVLIDTFGELTQLFAIATVVFMGGTTYPRNVLGLGQNMVEPLAQHLPIFFGEYASLWRAVTDELREEYAGLQVSNVDDLVNGCREVLGDAGLYARLADRARLIMSRHTDDVRRNVDLVARVVTQKGKPEACYAVVRG